MRVPALALARTLDGRDTSSVKVASSPRNQRYLHPRRINPAGVFALPERQHGGEIAFKLDPQAPVFGDKADGGDQGAQDVRRLGANLGARQLALQIRDLGPVELGEIGMETGLWRGSGRDREFSLAGFQALEFAFRGGGSEASSGG